MLNTQKNQKNFGKEVKTLDRDTEDRQRRANICITRVPNGEKRNSKTKL